MKIFSVIFCTPQTRLYERVSTVLEAGSPGGPANLPQRRKLKIRKDCRKDCRKDGHEVLESAAAATNVSPPRDTKPRQRIRLSSNAPGLVQM